MEDKIGKEKRKFFVLADIGGTTISTMMVDSYNNVLTKIMKRPTERTLPEERILSNIVCSLQDTISKAALKERQFVQLLVALPSRLDEKGNIIPCPNLPTFGEVNLAKELESRLNMPVFVSSDSYCFAAGEFAAGCAKGFRNFCAITLGTGVGLAFFINGKPFFGPQGLAGEIWTSAYCGGKWEDFVSANYMQSVYQEGTGEILEVKEIAKRAFDGEKKAREVFTTFGIHLAHGLSYVVNILDPEIIVFGGSISQSFELFKYSTIQTLRRYLVKNKRIIIKASAHPDVSSLFGIKWLYEHRYFTKYYPKKRATKVAGRRKDNV